MLAFLLDEHTSPKVATKLKKKNSEITVHTLQSRQQGRYLQAPDDIILDAAIKDSLTLISYDTRTIPALLKNLALQQKSHAGVIFVDSKTIKPNDIGGLVEALDRLWKAQREREWTNLCLFLKS